MISLSVIKVGELLALSSSAVSCSLIENPAQAQLTSKGARPRMFCNYTWGFLLTVLQTEPDRKKNHRSVDLLISMVEAHPEANTC